MLRSSLIYNMALAPSKKSENILSYTILVQVIDCNWLSLNIFCPYLFFAGYRVKFTSVVNPKSLHMVISTFCLVSYFLNNKNAFDSFFNRCIFVKSINSSVRSNQRQEHFKIQIILPLLARLL